MSGKELAKAHRVMWLAVLSGAVTGLSCQQLTIPMPQENNSPAPIQLKGAGAKLPAILYEEWFRQFSSVMPRIQISFDAVGSNEGVKRFLAGQIDFGATEHALNDEQMAKIGGSIQHIPVTAGVISLVYNLPEVPKLQLSREAYAGIFLGRITRWNDPVLAKCNPFTPLPDKEIRVVALSEASGPTYILTNHLSAVSPEWAESYGPQDLVAWPEGVLLHSGLEESAETVKATPGAIGYVDLSVQRKFGLPAAWLQNKAGTYVDPRRRTGMQALQGIKLPPDGRAYVPDPAGDQSYPIVGYSWLLIHNDYETPEKRRAVKQLIRWCLLDGQIESHKMNFVRLPGDVAGQNILAMEIAGQ
jgi:phosphate transport system substrate-binding protein